MKRILLLILAISLICFSQSDAGVIIRVLDVVGGDSCAANRIYSHHCENDDDPTAGALPGCSDSATYKSWTKSIAAYSGVQEHDGDYSVYCDADNCNAGIDNTGDWVDVEITGCWKAWIYVHSDDYVRLATPADTIAISFEVTSNILKITYGAETLSSVATVALNTWVYVEAGWDASQSAGSDKLRVKVGATDLGETDRTLTNQDAAATVYIIGASWQHNHAYTDQVELWASYDGT